GGRNLTDGSCFFARLRLPAGETREVTPSVACGSRRRLRLSAHHSDIGTRGVSDPRGRGVAGSSGPNRGSLTPRLLRVTASERRQRTPPRRAVASPANSVAP